MTVKKINNVPRNLKVQVRKMSDPNQEKTQRNASILILALMVSSMVLLNYKYAKGKL